MDAFSKALQADKREIIIAPTIYKCADFGMFAEEFKLNERDCVLTNEFILQAVYGEVQPPVQFRIPGEVRRWRAVRGYDPDHVRRYPV